MNWKPANDLTLAVVLALPLSAAEPAPTITVFVYNYAAIHSEALAKTKAEAARIYQHIGVEVQWLDCPLSPKEADQFPACQVLPGPTRLAIRILTESMAQRLRQARDCFGFALYPQDGSFATVANAFAHQAEQIASRHRLRQEVMLGHIVAHELGHLLLGVGSHAGSGIMHAPWLPKELESIAQGSMWFSSDESRKIQVNIRARMASEEKVESTTLGR